MHVRALAVIFALSMPAASLAQNRDPAPHFSIAPLYSHPNRDPLPKMGVPLPRIGLPLPPIGLRPLEPPRESARHHRSRFAGSWPVMFVMVPQYIPVLDPQPAAAVAAPAPAIAPHVEQPLQKGSLVLNIEPAATQVFVDGYYVGTSDDFSGQRGGAFLESGAHAVELIAPGYERVAFDVKIPANQATVYRHQMQRIQQAPPAPKVPTTFYLIPGCYMGNVPPKDAGLPATCDVTRTQTFRN